MIKTFGTLLSRLVLYVSLGLLLFAIVTGTLVYHFAYQHELENAASLERQLVRTVQTQAEVAAFASNIQIAENVIDGLRANPRIAAVRLIGSGAGAINVGAGFPTGEAAVFSTEYPLFSPVDGIETIGRLVVVRNEAMIEAQATLSALRQTLLLLVQVAAAAVLILFSFRQLVGLPIARLANDLAAAKPGSNNRLSVAPTHANDEIGSLAASANLLLASAEQAFEEIRTLATTDPLTQLPNRRAFMERMLLELARFQRHETTPASVLMLDLDHFKEINDQHGHGAGDAALQQFGRLLAGELRRIDSAGRLGGEEFAVLLPDTDVAAAAFFAERLRAKLGDTVIEYQGMALRLTTSIGVAAMRVADSRPEEIIARADQALYRAKASGRNRVELAPALP